MADHSQQRKPRTPAPPSARNKDAQRQTRKGLPGYIQSKMKLSRVGDAQEQEADRMADRVSRGDTLQRSSLQPGSDRDEERTSRPTLQAARLARQADESEEEETLQTQTLQQQADPEDETLQPRLLRQQDEEEQSLQAKGDAASVAPETEQRINALRGGGDSLPEQTRREMETRFNTNFSRVRIHNDTAAAELCQEVKARAFTVGNDIFFAPGEFAPETPAGKHLLAHELTHVLQQTGGEIAIQRRIEPAPNPPHAPGSASARALEKLSTLELPGIKRRHLPLYRSWASTKSLKRKRGYKRGRPNQIGVWKRDLQIDENALQQRLSERDVAMPTTPDGIIRFSVGKTKISASKKNLLKRLKIPDWDRHGRKPKRGFQVDHIIELQVSGEDGTGVGNSIENMELLDQRSNASSGSVIMGRIHANTREYLATLNPPPKKRSWLNGHDIIFERVKIGGGGRSEGNSAWWTRAEIQQAAPVSKAKPLPDKPLEGRANLFVLASGNGGVEMARYPHAAAETSIKPGNRRKAGAVAGLIIKQFDLNSATETGRPGTPIGSVTAGWDMPKKFEASGDVTIPLLAAGPYVGYLGEIPALNTNFKPLSPGLFASISVRPDGLYAEGSITPSLPIFAATTISATLNGSDVQFRADYAPENLSLPIPGLRIDDAMLTLMYGTRSGFAAAGFVYFSIDNLGEGSIQASVDRRGDFQASGNFNFDSQLFDRSRIRLWYRGKKFGGEGEIGIDTPNKIKGIRSANLKVGFGDGSFNAEGTVTPSIPGVEDASLTVGYSEKDGLVMGGTLNLSSEVPGIQSGSLTAKVRKKDDLWQVTASGSATPSIPGVNSELKINYDNGIFDASVTAEYAKGMMSGSLRAGVTNRSVDEDGRPSETAAANSPLIVYGGGSLTVQIAPWLQGTAGVKLRPNGELVVEGEIGLPSSLELFPRKEISREIFSINIDIPIVGVAVAGQRIGIFATIGGGLNARAGIGPGSIDQLRLGITYNPSREEDTRVTGNAHLNIPADAGLRLSVNGGLGAGIPIVSATAGLEVGGELGLQGAVEAGVDVDWRPGTGLEINANGEIYVEPKFKFDVSGFVKVEADLLLTTIDLYEKRWNLASFEYGSNLRFGIRFPIHYKEGEPFDISLDDVQFQVPEISPRDILGDLIDRVT